MQSNIQWPGYYITLYQKGNIYIKVQEAQKGYVQITVEDTGLGIKQDDLKKLFRDFQKVSNIEDTLLN